jgi:hypothetical protein
MFNIKQCIAPVALAFSLVACSSSDDDSDPIIIDPPPPPPLEYQFELTFGNLTNAQPLSPILAVLHQDSSIWTIGEASSSGLELLAESGDNSELSAASFVTANATTADVLPPGMTETVTIMTTNADALQLSLVTMLVNTNDAFTGNSMIDLSSLMVGDSLSLRSAVYDAGTEANSEASGTIPGPADGGEGFNSMRDDVDYVSRHPGVVGLDDGLSSSVLNNEHKFDNPAMSVMIVRVQ